MKLNQIIKALAAAGLVDVSPVKLTEDRRGLMIHHDYSGPYPTAEALHLAQAARGSSAPPENIFSFRFPKLDYSGVIG